MFFTRLGVLATARLALSACNRPDASDITEPQQAAQILACCLMMNELTSSTEPLTGVADLLVHQFANHNAMAHYDFRADLLRSLEMFERNRELLSETSRGLVDLEAEFIRVDRAFAAPVYRIVPGDRHPLPNDERRIAD